MKYLMKEAVITAVVLTAVSIGANRADAQVPALQAGDVLVVRTPWSPVSAFSYWTHCGLYDGRGNVIKAMPGTGVRKVAIQQFWASYPRIQAHRLAANSNTLGPRMVTYANGQIGAPYTLLPMFRGMDCIELVRQSFIYSTGNWRTYWWVPDNIPADSRFVCVARK